MPSPDWIIIERRGLDGLRSLESEWRRLCDDMPTRAAHHAYESHLAYHSHLNADPERLRCLALADGDRIRAVCPLELRTERVMRVPLRAWGLPLHPHWVLTDVVCPEDDARVHLVPAVAAHLRRTSEGGGLLTLGPLPQSSVLWHGLRQLDGRRYFVLDARPADVFDCSMSYEELMSRLSKHFRRNLRAAERKLNELAGVRYVTARDVRDLRTHFDSFLAVESSGWKGSDGTGSAIALHPELVAFYRDLAETLGKAGECEINALYADDRCLAAQFCVVTGDEYAVLKIGYDQACGRVAPGYMLLLDTLQRCCADPAIARVNLITDGPWQRDWHPDVVRMQQAHLAVTPFVGQAAVELMRFRNGWGRRFANRLRGRRDGPAKAGDERARGTSTG